MAEQQRFSRRFATLLEWLWDQLFKPKTAYRTRIRNYMHKHPEATLAEARGHKKPAPLEEEVFVTPKILQPAEEPLEMSYRYTLGTNISDKHVPLSFTGYFFSDGEFEYGEERRCYNIFADWVKRCIGERYRGRNYDINDVLGDWGGILREEHNAVVDHVPHGSGVLEFRVKGILRDSKECAWEYLTR